MPAMKSAIRSARAGGIGGLEPAEPFGRQVVRRFDVVGEQAAHHLLGLAHDPHDAGVAVEPRIEEVLDRAVGLRHRREKPTTGRPALAHIVRPSPARSSAMWRRLCAITSSIMRVIRRRISSWALAAGLEARMLRGDLAQDVAEQRQRREVLDLEQLGAQAVVDVVGVIGDVVGDGAALRLGAGIAPELEVVPARIVGDGARQAALAIARDRMPGAVGQRAVVLDQAFERLPGQIEPVEIGVAPLQRRHDVQRLRVVVEAAERREAVVERALAGMAERRMAEVVAERRGLGQVLVEPERAGERAGDLGHFQRVGQAGAEMVALVEHEHLGLVGEPAERGRMDDAVAIAAEGAAGGARGSAKRRPRLRAGSDAKGARANAAIAMDSQLDLAAWPALY